MGAALHHFSCIKHNNFVTVTNGTEAVGNDDAGTASAAKVFVYRRFRNRIKSRSCLIHDKDAGIGGQSTGNFQTLPLSAAEILSALNDFCIVAFRAGNDNVMDTSILCRLHILVNGNSRIPHGDVVLYGAVKNGNGLVYYRDGCRENLAVNLGDRLSVKEDVAFPLGIEAAEKFSDS